MMLRKKVNINILGFLVATGACYGAGIVWTLNPLISATLLVMLYAVGLTMSWLEEND